MVEHPCAACYHPFAGRRWEGDSDDDLERYVGLFGVFVEGATEIFGVARIGRYMPKSGRFYLDGVPGLRRADGPYWSGPGRGHDNGGAWADLHTLAFAFGAEDEALAFVAAVEERCTRRREEAMAAMRARAEAVTEARAHFRPLLEEVEREFRRRQKELLGRLENRIEDIERDAAETERAASASFDEFLANAAGQPRLRLRHRFWLHGRPYVGREPIVPPP